MAALTTPNQLAAELGVSGKRVRDVLRAEYGLLSFQNASRWLLSEEQVAFVRRAFRSRNTPTRSEPEWSIELGETLARRTVHQLYGGQWQGGISTPKNFPDILVFTSSDSSNKFGYGLHEGLNQDGSFSYTGEGQTGDQDFTGGNRALLEATDRGRLIRLFVTDKTQATYVGTFTNGFPSHRFERILDRGGNPRNGIIFNLVPVEAETALLPVNGEEPPTAIVFQTWRRPEYSELSFETEELTEFGTKTVSRLEFKLQSEFGDWLIASGTPPQTIQIPVENNSIQPDFYVPARNWIVEAKRSTGRAHFRTAIGQVLDYVHCASLAGVKAKPVILLPGKPEASLGSLAEKLGIIVVHQHRDGFEVL